MSMDTTVDFRRKLLRFTRPHYLDYARHTIPRYYSNFGPRFRTLTLGLDCANVPPKLYPPRFAVNKVYEPECPCDVQFPESLLGPGHSGMIFWIYMVILVVVILMLKR